MSRFKLESFRSRIKNYLNSNYESLCEWIVSEGNNCRKGLSLDVRRDNICYGIFFHLPQSLKNDMSKTSDHEDSYIASIMISVLKEMGVYDNIN